MLDSFELKHSRPDVRKYTSLRTRKAYPQRHIIALAWSISLNSRCFSLG
jgi:hypothetical protein